jgi:hypothetical protein
MIAYYQQFFLAILITFGPIVLTVLVITTWIAVTELLVEALQIALIMVILLSIVHYTAETIWHCYVVGNNFVASAMQAVIFGHFCTAFASIAQYAAETIWHYCVVWIHLVASAVQAVIFGLFSIAFALVKNSLSVVTTGITLILFAVWELTAFVLRTVCKSIYPSLLEAQDEVIYEDGYSTPATDNNINPASVIQAIVLLPFCIAFALAKNSLFVVTMGLLQVFKLVLFALRGAFRMAFGSTDTDNDHESDSDCDYDSDQSEEERYSASSYDQQIPVLRRLPSLFPLHRQGRVNYRSY